MKAVLVAVAAMVIGSTPGISEILVKDAWVRTVPPGGVATGMFMTIENTGSKDDLLISADTEYAQRNEIHLTEKDNGVMTMKKVDQIKIPGSSKVELKPGSYHVMLIKLTKTFKVDDELVLTLTFRDAGQKQVKVIAKDVKAAGSMSH